jgi:hypothetical protein
MEQLPGVFICACDSYHRSTKIRPGSRTIDAEINLEKYRCLRFADKELISYFKTYVTRVW